MSKSNALYQDWVEGILTGVENGDRAPAVAVAQLVENGWETDEAWDHVSAALQEGKREQCDRCNATGAIDAAWSGIDPCCPDCGGAGSRYVGDDAGKFCRTCGEFVREGLEPERCRHAECPFPYVPGR